MAKKLKYFIRLSVITYLLIELVCFVFIKTNYISAKLPQFFSDPMDTLVFPFPYADVNPDWGVWHYNYPIKVPSGCVTVECYPNSIGARDKERLKITSDTNRCIVLGDSFMEGFGISTHERLSNLLEDRLGKEFLNFACSDMGSTQEYLVYEKLASSYSHNSVLVGILPANDFLNDNIEFDKGQTPIRYKPYWTGIYPNMTIYYHTKDINQSQFNYESYRFYKSTIKYKVRHFLENTTCWFNILYYISRKKGASDFVKTRVHGNNFYSGYYDFNLEDLERLQQSLLKIRKIAADKKMIVFTIPVKNDYLRHQKDSNELPLVKVLNNFCLQNGIIYKDLLSSDTTRNYNDYYFDCDMHWSEKGNKMAFNQLLPLFEKSN